MRTNKDLLLVSKEYASEDRWQSWWHLCSTLGVFGGLVTFVCLDLPWFVRLPGSIALGLLIVRLFVLNHDYQHGTIFRGSPLAGAIMYACGLLALSPPGIWNRSHDHHHKNNSKVHGANIGSYPLMTREGYADASFWVRFRYAASRHPLTIALGYVTVFLYGMCLRPLLADPRRHYDSGLAIFVHLCLVTWLVIVAWEVLLLAVIIPMVTAGAMGAYLFYAQHNFPGVKFREREDWNHVFAALNSSSYIRMNPLMHWFTGNIGYHHVHHLNAKIPFYRLPKAMSGLVELQSPNTTSLHPLDVVRCLRLKLWDAERDCLVSFRKATQVADENDLTHEAVLRYEVS